MAKPLSLTMGSLFKQKVLKLRQFSRYSLFFGLDKALNLLILYVLIKKNVSNYNEIEYVISIASILYIAIESGLGSYIFEEFKEHSLTNSRIIDFRSVLSLLLILTVILSLGGLSMGCNLVTYAALQIGYLSCLKLEISIWRVKDKPSVPFVINSMLSSVLIMVLLLAEQGIVEIYFSSRFFIVLFYIIKFIKLDFELFKKLMFKSWNYSLPINLNVIASMFMLNVIKIVGWNTLQSDTLASLNIVFRISSLITMAHSAVSGFLMKSNYQIDSTLVRVRRIWSHSVLILMLVGCLSGITYGLMHTGYLNMNISFGIFTGILSIASLSSIAAYTEVFLARLNRRWIILLSSILGTVCFLLLSYIFNISLTSLVLSVVMANIIIIIIRLFYVISSK